jgi:hypothetical protein
MKNATNNRFKMTLIVAAMLSLTACGGGGGAETSTNGSGSGSGSGATTPAPLNVTKQAVTSSLKENSSFALTFAVSGAVGNIRVTDASVASASTPVTGNAQVNGNTVTYVVNAGEAKLSNGQHTVTLQIADDSRSVTVTQPIVIENTSANARIEELTSLKASATTFSSLTEEKALFDKIGEVAKLVNPEYLPNETTLKNKFAAAIADTESQTPLNGWIVKTENTLSGYAAGSVSEDELTRIAGDITAPLNARASKANVVINELLTYTTSVVPSLPVGTVFVGDKGVGISQFEGNSALGSYIDGVWSYNTAYKFMTAITAPELNTCKAQ